MTTWVLLRGLAREARHWGGFAEDLRAALPASDDVWAPDLPGNGARHAERSLAVAAAAGWLHEALHARTGRSGPCIPVALSLGGMVALEWARLFPQDVAACVLINSSDGRHSPPWQRMQPAALWQLVLAAGARDALARESRILRLTSNRLPDPRLAAAWAGYACECPTSGANALRQLVGAARFRSAGSAPAVPVLLLASTADRLVASACSQALVKAWGAPLRLHPTAGHDLPLDEPGWVVAQVGEWARSLRASAGTTAA